MNKKKSLSGNSLRSPAAKRSVQSPVAMKGWLYKQGSDGLMLWKKRWFVLSDFCLFYYKGPEEDKILGSILLPSYKISPCNTDDRIYRKFAFKAEHHNMRTYYFASETKKEMQQWMNAMSLASILQNNGSFGNREEILERTGIDLTSVGSVTGNEDEDSGFTSYHSRRPANSPHQDGNSTLTDSYTSNDIYRGGLRADDSLHDSASESSYPEGYLGSADKYPNPNYGGGHQMHPQVHSNVFQQAGTPSQHGSKQHLYANAPPKPKRMGGPNDVYVLNRESEVMSPRQHTSQGQYVDYIERGKSGQHPQLVALRATREQPLMAKHRQEEYQGPVSSQRRTPDPYARTAIVQGFEYAAPSSSRHERNGHYSDEYAAAIAAVAGQMHSQGHEEYQRRQPIEYQPLRVPKGSAGGLRPHSAEFLEHEVYADKGHHDMIPTHQRRARNGEIVQTRPRSSIERYALPEYITNESELAEYRTQLLDERLQAAGKENQHLQELINERRSGVRTSREVTPSKVNAAAHNMSFDSYLTRDASYGSLHSAGAPQQSQSKPRPHHMPSSHLEKLSTTPSASMLALDAASRNSGSAGISPLARAEGSRTLPRDRSFMRSASARLPTATSMNSVAQNRYSSGGREDTRWKAQQREESMKRLLEWKQRMLQSPLTKKYPSKGGAAGLLLQTHSVPSSAATTPSSGMARLLLNDQQQNVMQQHRPTTPHRSTTPQQLQQQQQQQQTPTQTDSTQVSSARMQANEYRQQVLKELMNQESGLKNQPTGPLRAEENPERNDRNSLHWRDKDLTKGRESHDQTIIGKIEKGVKGSRTPSRSPNRTQEHRRSTSSLNRYYNSYSSDDEESWSGSLRNQKENRSPLRQQALRLPQKKKHRNDATSVSSMGLKTVREDINVSDSEAQVEMKMQNVKLQKYLNEKDYDDPKVKLTISAGDLLGKTHEELVLLLIQLRRDQAKLEQEMHNYSVELDTEHKMLLFDTSNRGEHANKQKQLIKQYEELTKQYDLTKPLINLVDNMVKLGSLYGGSEQMLATQYQLDKQPPQDYTPPKKMIEFSRRLQEQRLLQHEREEWDQIAPEQVDLQGKLQELCKLDQTLHEESYFVSGLQQDKDMLEKAVESLKIKLDTCRESPIELEKLQKQLRAAEKELTKIRSQLTRGTKKLEETASDNAKIENEILVLRQKMQASIKQGLSSGSLNEASHVKVQLEKELSRISNVMEDLAWKREELSGALEQLKDRNKALLADVRASPTGVAGSAALPGRKNHRSTYLETDLDTMETRDIIESWKRGEGLTPSSSGQRRSQVPLYVNTYNNNGLETSSLTTSSINSSKEDVNSSVEYVQSEQTDGEGYKPQDINDADDKMKRFYGILPREKPAEIKTVRIVKRESERRNKGRDRRKPNYEGEPSLTKLGEDDGEPSYFEDPELTEEMLLFQRSMSLPRNYGRSPYLLPGQHADPHGLGLNIGGIASLEETQPCANALTPNSANNKNVSYYYRTPSLSNLSSESNLSAHERLFGNPLNGIPTNPETTSPTLFTPAFKSEAARKIVAETAHELASNISTDFPLNTDVVSHSPEKYDAGSLKRRQKRRHYTISSSQPIVMETISQKMVHARSRDDLDIERCLRASNTPDVVKSTIKKNEMFDESTIDRELGLPQKILIPERYVEEENEELSAAEQLHRLQKAESIRKMLSESSTFGDVPQEEAKSATLKKKFEADRKQREHLLALNQIIAKEVMERSKAVAAKAMKNRSKPPAPKPEVVEEDEEEEDSESPDRPLPIIQQRENLLT